MNVWAVVVAAGRGTRANLGMNKVFYPIGGRPVVLRTLDALERSGEIHGAVVVLQECDRPHFAYLLERESYKMEIRTAVGGDIRQQSVLNGLTAAPEDCGIALIHDAARPFVSSGIIRETIRAARESGSGVISTPVTDTIKILSGSAVATPDRDTLRAVQTPQTFRYREILQYHRAAAREGFLSTDDAALFEHYTGSVTLVTAEGAQQNRKITTREDIDRLSPLRVGMGYDAHRLVSGRKLVLCGVEVPHETGLLGHSDADVALHALMDALLGAAGAGDIGRHFPDSDPAYAGISSLLLLRRVVDLLREKGYRVVNCDITIVCQRPRLSPFIDEMARNVALAVETDQVNVKATTTERMGFEGEEKGISASAVALLERI